MKNLLRVTILGILATGTLSAQSFVDKTETTEFNVMESNVGEPLVVKTVTQELHPIIFDEKDKTELNQDIVETPTFIDKIILVDTDNDQIYDKEAFFSFTKEEDEVITEAIMYDLENENIDDENLIYLEDVYDF